MFEIYSLIVAVWHAGRLPDGKRLSSQGSSEGMSVPLTHKFRFKKDFKIQEVSLEKPACDLLSYTLKFFTYIQRF